MTLEVVLEYGSITVNMAESMMSHDVFFQIFRVGMLSTTIEQKQWAELLHVET